MKIRHEEELEGVRITHAALLDTSAGVPTSELDNATELENEREVAKVEREKLQSAHIVELESLKKEHVGGLEVSSTLPVTVERGIDEGLQVLDTRHLEMSNRFEVVEAKLNELKSTLEVTQNVRPLVTPR